MKKLIILSALFLVSISMHAQSGGNFKITGTILDTLENSMISATVLLLERSDSTLLEFTRTELDGSFKFKDLRPGNYIVKSTYIGYLPLGVNVSSNGENIDLGKLYMTEIAAELMEVVIKAAKAPMVIRGDTIEYDASTFKVPEGSSVEELLKRLPGIELDRDGSMTSDGKDISKVTVDGKSFFGSDPKAATKNLPAEGISKIQVFDKKDEQSEITGETTASTEKTMNLELKEGFKNGGFGKVVGGYGTFNRAELKGNYNKFNDKIQFSLVGVGNNTGRNGLGWNDYQDFLGANAFNFNDDGDYGFGGRNNYFYFGGNGGSGIDASIQSIFFNDGGNGGLPINYNTGINFNYDHNKSKFSAVYFYNNSQLANNSTKTTENFFDTFNVQDLSENETDNRSGGHRAELSFEQELDSLHTIKLSANGALINEIQESKGNISLSRNDTLTNNTAYDNTSNTDGYLSNAQFVFRKKFKKKGRNLGFNTSYRFSQLNEQDNQNSDLTFYDNLGQVDNITNINQEITNVQDNKVFKVNGLYVEPLGKRFFLQGFYNFSNQQETGDRGVFDRQDDSRVLNENLSREYNNQINRNRVGSVFRYSHEGYNISLGLAYQIFHLTGVYQGKGQSSLYGTVDNTYRNWVPNLDISISPSRTLWTSFSYGFNTSEPSLNQLNPVIDNSNPLYITEGNPDLQPVQSHAFSIYGNKSFPASGFRLSGGANFDEFTNNIIQEQTIDENLITTSRPINFDGGRTSNLWSYVSVPLIKNKLKITGRYNFNWSNSFSIINQIINKANTSGQRPRLSLSWTPTKEVGVEASTSFNFTNTTYDVSTTQNNNTRRTKYSLEVNAKTFAGIYFNTSFDYSLYQNDRFQFNQAIPILNASIYRHFLKGNKLETRISLYDGFNRNLAVSQFPSENGFTEQTTNSLGRYIMFSMAYNIRGLKSDLDNNRHF